MEITDSLILFDTISLKEMKSVKLMNRIDTKYVISISQLSDILNLLSENYYVQTDVNGNRMAKYQTVYLDTDGKQMYISHETRRKTRTKVRVRKYLDTQDMFLEIKNKNNHGRTSKTRIPTPSLANALTDKEANEFLESHTQYCTSELSAHLQNEFQRITLVNKEKTERLTIDINLCFHNHQNGNRADLSNIAIIELKRDGRSISYMKDLLVRMQIRKCGFSKYCIGTALTDNTVRTNNIKERLRHIKKINTLQ